MANLKERIERLEWSLDNEGQPQILVVRLIGSESDLRELPADSESWLTWPTAYAKRELPMWPGGVVIVQLDSEAERQARVRAAEGQKN